MYRFSTANDHFWRAESLFQFTELTILPSQKMREPIENCENSSVVAEKCSNCTANNVSCLPWTFRRYSKISSMNENLLSSVTYFSIKLLVYLFFSFPRCISEITSTKKKIEINLFICGVLCSPHLCKSARHTKLHSPRI